MLNKTRTSKSRIAMIAIALSFLAQSGCSAVHSDDDPSTGDATSGGPQAYRIPGARYEPLADSARPDQEGDLGPSLVSLSAGAFVTRRPSEWAGFASAFNLLDERSPSIWATERSVTSPQTIVIALAERTLLKVLEFDNGSAELQFKGCSAKDITIEMSDESGDAGFSRIARVSLAERTNGQRFAVSAEVPGRWVRLTVENNHGSNDVTELGEFRAYGAQLTATPFPDVSGTYDADSTGVIHLSQQGSSIAGCYESRRGLVEGGVEGHVFRFTWIENTGGALPGHGIMVFAPDAQQFASLWWGPFDGGSYGGLLVGTRTSDDVGSCPHWTGAGNQLTTTLEKSGRAKVYGINFDNDSDTITAASKSSLETIVAVLTSHPEWTMTIEGHTDSVSTAEHNQDLSERRAIAVREYLRGAGVDASRLKTVGYGSTRPVTDNDTELGRAQNRRVELTTL